MSLLPPSERPRDAEAVRQIAHAGVVAVAARRAQIGRIVLPGAAPQHVLAAIVALARQAVRRRAVIILVPAIGHPLRHIAAHVVKPEGGGGKAPDVYGMMGIIRLAAALAGGDAGPHFVAPPILRLRAAARRIFPLGLARQAVGWCR